MRRPVLQCFAILAMLRALQAAPPPAEAPTAQSPAPLRLAYSASYAVTFECLSENEPLNKKPEARFFAVKMALTSDQGPPHGAEPRRFVAGNVRIMAAPDRQFDDPKAVEQTRQFFEKLRLPVPTTGDETADYQRLWDTASRYSDEYTETIARVLVPPPYPLPSTNRRGNSVVLREDPLAKGRSSPPGVVFESTTRIVPHICYFDGWVADAAHLRDTIHLVRFDQDPRPAPGGLGDCEVCVPR